MHSEATSLTAFLSAQRWCVLEVVDGLDELELRRSTVPSGWTPLGMIEHLADAERFWFQHVVAGADSVDATTAAGSDEGSWEDNGPFVTQRSAGDTIALYREQVKLADQILAGVPLDAPPAGPIPPDMDEIHTVRDVVLHMIEETARHVGHLDIARELLDGRTGLGPR
jgi:hypothetical protein